MAALTQDLIRSLAGFRGADAPVVSLYLDVDGRRYVRPKDYEQQFDALVRSVKERANGSSPRADLERISGHVRKRLDRSHTRGLAIFSCVAHDLWTVLELPVPVRNQLVVNATPHVRQLETVLSENERFGVLLADRQRARMFVFELGELADKSELFDQLPRHEDDGGEWDRDHVRDHVADAAHKHLKRAAQVAFHVFQERPFDHLILAAPDEIARSLEGELHSYLRDRIAARLPIAVGASEALIRDAALEVEREVERAHEAAAVIRLRDHAGNGRAVTGLEPVLGALTQRRVESLLVSDGFEAPGWHCHACGFVGVKGRKCPVCSVEMAKVDDIVEEAVEIAIGQACRVRVCVANADLDVLGRIGALLRY